MLTYLFKYMYSIVVEIFVLHLRFLKPSIDNRGIFNNKCNDSID